MLIEPLALVRGGGCISVKLRRVAARDNSRQWAAAERRACASRWNATAPEAGAGLFPDFRGRKLAGHGAERCEVKRCGVKLPTFLWPLFRLCAVRFLRTDRAFVCGLRPV